MIGCEDVERVDAFGHRVAVLEEDIGKVETGIGHGDHVFTDPEAGGGIELEVADRTVGKNRQAEKMEVGGVGDRCCHLK